MFLLLIVTFLSMNQELYSLHSNQTLSCCDMKKDPTSSSCFFKHNKPHQIQTKQKFVGGSVIGGLGNQLFIMFTTISYAIKHNLPFIFDYSYEVGDRKTHWEGMYASLTCFSTKTYPKWHAIIRHLPTYNEKEFYFTEIPSPTQLNMNKFNGMKLNGYYQSYKYFDEHKHIIFHAMNAYNSQSQIYDLYYDKYFNTTKQVVAMHFRIGDYALPTKTKVHPIMPLQHYMNAIQQVIADLNVPKSSISLLCVYDPSDSERINTDYLEPLRIKFPGIELIVVDSAIPDWHQMLLMSLCQVIIIANSTFSWYD